MADRMKLRAGDQVVVCDYADVGDLYYGEMTEDGERPVLRPDHQAVIRLETDHGEIYQLATLTFAGGEEAFEEAGAVAGMIRAKGSVNLDRWTFIRVMYGSRAYEEYGQADDVAREKEEARWEPQGAWVPRPASRPWSQFGR